MTNLTEMGKCTFYIRRGDRCTISCKLGLWGVSGPWGNMLLREAMSYFQQYKSDGEYSDILGGDDVLETLLKQSQENKK